MIYRTSLLHDHLSSKKQCMQECMTFFSSSVKLEKNYLSNSWNPSKRHTTVTLPVNLDPPSEKVSPHVPNQISGPRCDTSAGPTNSTFSFCRRPAKLQHTSNEIISFTSQHTPHLLTLFWHHIWTSAAAASVRPPNLANPAPPSKAGVLRRRQARPSEIGKLG